MNDVIDIWDKPEAKEVFLITGWRQWADAGSISSGLPQYLIKQSGAYKIGEIRSDGFYLFQIPATHDLVRPPIQFEKGFPKSLETPRNELYYAGDEERGIIFFTGDEPHMNPERYVSSYLDVAESLNVKRIVGFGGVYGELPYAKERMLSCIYSLPELRGEMEGLSVNLSDYHGGASIGSYICRRAGERGLEYVGLYAFVPTYDFSKAAQIGNVIRIENDYMAWLGAMRRVNYMLKTRFDLADLESKSERLVSELDAKLDELDGLAPQLDVHDYMSRLGEQFDEVTFDPLDEVWEEEFKRLFDEGDSD
jgi:proteasome assembly chaperone (PAC2) family protein